MVKTMKRGFSLLFVISLLASMLVIPAAATNSNYNVTIKRNGSSVQYATIHTDKSFLGLKTTTVIVKNTSSRSIVLYDSIGRIGYAYTCNLNPGCSHKFTAKANGKEYGIRLQRGSWGSGDAVAQVTIKNGY